MIQLKKSQSQPVSSLSGWARRRVTGKLQTIASGMIELIDGGTKTRLGRPGAALNATVQVHDRRFYRQAMLGPMAIAEAYLDGRWDCNQLVHLFRIFLRNRERLSLGNSFVTRTLDFGRRMLHGLHANSLSGSRRNIASHYDLGNDFFRLWLDETMAYSSGIFLNPTDSMQQASIEKADRVCRKLNLMPTDCLLEIGTGFGGLSLHAAEHYGCQITTTTISDQQHAESALRFRKSSAGDGIRLLKQDYRELQGKYDKLVSIEMIEAVGHRFLDTFFSKCSDLLKADGTMLLQAIVMPETAHRRYLKSVDFLQRFIFPGGCLPSLASMLESAGRASDFRFVHAEDLAPHYARTLELWRKSFKVNLPKVRQMGYAERLIRQWNYYLCYCQAAFEERHVGVLQVVFDKPKCRRDPIEITRWSAAPLTGSANSASRVEPIVPPRNQPIEMVNGHHRDWH